MDGRTFDAWTRGAVNAVTRRASLLALLGVASAVGAPGSAAAVGKAAKRAKKKCKKQVGKCQDEVATFCRQFAVTAASQVQGEGGEEEDCRDGLNRCCEPLKTCNAGASTSCFLDAFSVQDQA